ncbi:MAG TPA: hypothetical protein VJU84_12525 [Pyrinomonadaceae bacterium]|nr:hypothetical protein [Pyrinomonadaceae bacterium]
MTSIIVRQFSQLLLLASPVLTLHWSLLDWLGYGTGTTAPVSIDLFVIVLSGPKEVVELKIRVLLILVGCCLVLLLDVLDHYLPKRDFDSFRALYLDELKQEWREFLGEEIRINVLHARRRWFFPLIRIFYWTWNDGFAQTHLDGNLFLTTWQGVAGETFRRRRPLLVDFRESKNQILRFYERWLPFNQFHLWPRQISKTKELCCILSIPMFISSQKLSPKWRPVGVINLDTLSDAGADFLVSNQEELSKYFMDYGKIIAYLG